MRTKPPPLINSRAVNYDEARQVALARNPNARIISVNAKF